MYPCHVKLVALSRTDTPCTGLRGWASLPNSPIPASPDQVRGGPAQPGYNGNRPCWRDARVGSREEADAGLREEGRWKETRKNSDWSKATATLNHSTFLTNNTAAVPAGPFGCSCSGSILLLLLLAFGSSALPCTRWRKATYDGENSSKTHFSQISTLSQSFSFPVVFIRLYSNSAT